VQWWVVLLVGLMTMIEPSEVTVVRNHHGSEQAPPPVVSVRARGRGALAGQAAGGLSTLLAAVHGLSLTTSHPGATVAQTIP
jgi:hypothetical protein